MQIDELWTGPTESSISYQTVTGLGKGRSTGLRIQRYGRAGQPVTESNEACKLQLQKCC